MEQNLYPTLKRSVYRRSKGRVCKKNCGEKPPDPYFPSLRSRVHPTFWWLTPPLDARPWYTTLPLKQRRRKIECLESERTFDSDFRSRHNERYHKVFLHEKKHIKYEIAGAPANPFELKS